MHKSILFAFTLSGFIVWDANASCEKFTPYGQPVHKSVTSDVGLIEPPFWDVICHSGQFVAFNRKHNVSDWVAFHLQRKNLLNPTAKRKDNFRQDPRVPKNHRVDDDDYKKTGYVKGHLAPAASLKWSQDAMDDSFFMTNIAPQVHHGFNNGIWSSLERYMRQWACQRGTLYVVTGPLYETKPIRKLEFDADEDGKDDNGVLVDLPSHFFKFAVDPVRMEAIAFILPNQKIATKDLHKYLTSIADIEDRSKLDFLNVLWDNAEDVVEGHVQPELWKKPDDKICSKLN